MDYNQSVEYVQNANLFDAKKNGLKNMEELLHRLGNPHHGFNSIHVAGTNGKGSICAYLESALREAGYKTGLFTSPYLIEFSERIRIAGINVDKSTFAKVATLVREHAMDMKNEGLSHPTFFELITAICFYIFNEENIDIGVVETGIGGTLDATNVLDPILCVITSIGMDHVKVLGNTIDEIARNKAGIIKPGCPVVVYPQPYDEAYARILSTAMNMSADVYPISNANILVNSLGLKGGEYSFDYNGMKTQLTTPLLGLHQILNSATAFLTLCVLSQQTSYKITLEEIKTGIKNTVWAGRLQVISTDPLVIIDGGHNKQGAKAMTRAIKEIMPIGKSHVICGIFQNKDIISIAKEIASIAKTIYVVEPDTPRAMSAQDLELTFQEIDPNMEIKNFGSVAATLSSVLEIAKADNTPIVICGSLYLAGEVLAIYAK